ncbi:MAG: hypothetical protein IKN11_06085 [Bacteroidales bacterium]|nr:hypothetical protein [Bacteroidales bacterium]
MYRRLWHILLLATTVALTAGCKSASPDGEVNLRLRARVDSLNKGSFINRYENPHQSLLYAYRAVGLLRDSLPAYHDGMMRAYNNLAFGYYMLAEHDSAAAYLDSVTAVASQSWTSGKRALRRNVEVERVLAELMQVRLLQRSCRIADSYQLLYNINQSKVLKSHPENYLYSFAQMEYFITSLTLNYHYRNMAVASSSGTTLSADTKKAMAALLAEVEEARRGLKCDYAEEMSLNYALAHSYYRLAAASQSDPFLLGKAYDYLADNAKLLAIPGQGCIYHLANVFQLQAFIAADTNIRRSTYTSHPQCHRKLARLTELTNRLYATDTSLASPDYGLNMFEVSTALFFQTADPYQHLGAVVAAAEYCLHEGEYDRAYDYYTLALEDTTWHDGMAPKFESMFYDGLIRMGYSLSAEDNTRWYAREIELLDFINRNESADLQLQDRLFRSETRNRYYGLTIAVGTAFLLLLGVLVLLLRHRSRVLRAEKQALQEAKRQDVERIANVETCLSVLRHDINPFLSYLTNKKLSPEMRQEVLEQLLRTFTNIKNWTNLSIPSGLQFQASCVSLAEVMESVKASCPNIHSGEVELGFEPTTLCVDGDRQLIEILLRNLVNNALQHTQQGEVKVAADTYEEDSRFVHLSVADTGCGMDEETVDSLFRADRKIHSASDPQATHGTGFGLILCRYIIKRHDDNTLRGCRIWVESQVGQGTVMHCLLAKHNNPGT